MARADKKADKKKPDAKSAPVKTKPVRAVKPPNSHQRQIERRRNEKRDGHSVKCAKKVNEYYSGHGSDSICICSTARGKRVYR